MADSARVTAGSDLYSVHDSRENETTARESTHRQFFLRGV